MEFLCLNWPRYFFSSYIHVVLVYCATTSKKKKGKENQRVKESKKKM
jgi:hypothetical protein